MAARELLFVSMLLAVLSFFAATCASKLGKIYAAGSGQNMLSLPETIQEIVSLSGKSAPKVLYLGTATYDDTGPEKTQTQAFIDLGLSVSTLSVAVSSPSIAEMRSSFEKADIVIVSGGNTLFARDRWVKLGIDGLMREAMTNGTVLSGGSAGAIIWFDGGHSDSMEPDSYKNPPGPLLNPNITAAELAAWAYIRVPGISILHALACPHYDMTGSNGVPREEDFTKMLQHHSGENAVGIDNWAALVIEGDTYKVISRKGKAGSVGENGHFAPNRTGIPGMWKMTVTEEGVLERTLAPMTGDVVSLFPPPRYISQSTQLAVARAQNPDDGKPAAWNSSASSSARKQPESSYGINNQEWWW